MIRIIFTGALLLLASAALAQDEKVTGCKGDMGYASECPPPPAGRAIPNWGNYHPASENYKTTTNTDRCGVVVWELAPRCHDISDMHGWRTPAAEAACGWTARCADPSK